MTHTFQFNSRQSRNEQLWRSLLTQPKETRQQFWIVVLTCELTCMTNAKALQSLNVNVVTQLCTTYIWRVYICTQWKSVMRKNWIQDFAHVVLLTQPFTSCDYFCHVLFVGLLLCAKSAYPGKDNHSCIEWFACVFINNPLVQTTDIHIYTGTLTTYTKDLN